jgi:hypothetical protein
MSVLALGKIGMVGKRQDRFDSSGRIQLDIFPVGILADYQQKAVKGVTRLPENCDGT